MSQLFDDMQKEAASVAMTKSNNLTYPMLDDMANRFNTRLSEPASSTAKVMPSGDKLKSYAKAHFNGDETAAKDYLSTQGYK